MPQVIESPAELPHIVVLHRYTGPIASYAEYINHKAFHVTYVTTRDASRVLDKVIAAEMVVIGMSGEMIATRDDIEIVASAVVELANRFGPVSRIVALYEGDLQMGAALRERFGIDGDRPAEVAPFRDKLLMHDLLTASDVPTVPTAAVESRESVDAFSGRCGWPLITKPRAGTASSGISVLRDAQEVPSVFADGLIVQPFIDSPILHVDGFFDGSDLVTWTASAYVNSCLEYNDGAVLGSTEIEDSEKLAPIGEIVRDALRVLAGRPIVFHAELIVVGGDYSSLLVLEIGARVGGAEVAYIWREIHGIDLVHVGFLIQVGQSIPAAMLPAERPMGVGAQRAGWLLVPPAEARPCIVVSANSQTQVAGLQAEVLPRSGDTMLAVGGYERTGARFRFASATTADVRDAIDDVLRNFQFECRPAPTVIVVGSGGQKYREYGLRALATQNQIVLLDTQEPTWQRAYISGHVSLDPAAIDGAISEIERLKLSSHGGVGIMTWDETMVRTTAQLAESTGLSGMSVQAVANCRDKASTRSLLSKSLQTAVRFEIALTADDAHRAAAAIGYPVVVKPRSMAGSAGVVRVDTASTMANAFTEAASASFPGLEDLPGVIVEEFLVGEEISVDSVVVDCVPTIANVARKRLGAAPYFEEIGHLVKPWKQETWAGEVTDLVEKVHAILGVTAGVTHAEMRLTPSGPRLIELNCRLGGDFIPLLGYLATGFDLVVAAAEVALGVNVEVPEGRQQCAEVAFIYLEEDSIIESVDLRGTLAIPGINAVHILAAPGATLLLPPRGVVPRVAAVIAVGDTEVECSNAIALAKAELRVHARPASLATSRG